MGYLKDCCRMCVTEFVFVFIFFLYFLLSWVSCVFPSTRGSSDSIAPRDSLPGDERFPHPLLHGPVHAEGWRGQEGQGGKSGVESWTAAKSRIMGLSKLWSRTEVLVSVRDQISTGHFRSVRKSRSLMQKHIQTPVCFCVCAQILPTHSFTHSSIHVHPILHGYCKGM